MDKPEIILDLEGRYEKIIIFDGKSYVLLEYSGDKIIKGNTLKGRSNEGFTIQFISDGIDHIFNDQIEKIKEDFLMWKDLIESKMLSVDLIVKRVNINMSLEEYRNKRASGQNALPTYEAALLGDREYIKGDVLHTWVEEPEPVIKTYKTRPDKEVIPNVSASEAIRLQETFNGNIYRKYYHTRLEKALKRFFIVIGLERFMEWFPDLTIYSDDKLKLIPVLGYDKFMEYFPDYTWNEKSIKKLSEKDRLKL